MEKKDLEYGASFIEACREIGRAILNSVNSHPIYIFSHFDADGIAAASILAKTLSREGLSFHLRIFERLEYQALNKLKKIIPTNNPKIKILFFFIYGISPIIRICKRCKLINVFN